MGETWLKIPDYENYLVSNLGNVKNNISDNLLKPIIDRYGYGRIRLYKNAKWKNYRVHQIVAMAFLNHKIDGFKLVVNHINGIKNDNRVENLEIVTQRENASNCYRINNDKFTSNFVGVSWSKACEKWRSTVKFKRKTICLGLFDTEIECKNLYNEAIININNGNFEQWCYKNKIFKMEKTFNKFFPQS
jgi:hypothetical protein